MSKTEHIHAVVEVKHDISFGTAARWGFGFAIGVALAGPVLALLALLVTGMLGHAIF